MTRIQQKLSVSVSQPATPWKTDVVLDTPILKTPADGDLLCPHQAGATSNIILEWEAVTSAQFYVLQWCNNTSFQGPTLRSIKQAGTTYDLPLGETGIRMGEEIHWRVMAFNNSGGVSYKSDSWTVKYDCDDKHATGAGDNKSGGPSGGPGNQSKCSDFDIDMEITGDKLAFCCDEKTWKLDMSWNCIDANGRSLLTLNGVTWSIVQPAGDPGNAIKVQANDSCTVTTNCNADQVFTLKAKASFTDLVSGGVFFCEEEKKIYVDCTTPPGDKPWTQAELVVGPYGYSFPLHPDYWGDTIAPYEIYRSVGSITGVTVLDPSDATEPASPAGDMYGDVPITHVAAMGPVVRTGYEEFANAGTAGATCYPKIDGGPNTGEIHESQTHLSFGCGLREHDGRIDVYNEHLAGRVGSRKGIGARGHCSLEVLYGCGLTMGGPYGEELESKVTPLTSAGIVRSVVPGSLAVTLAGCYLKVEISHQAKELMKNDCGVLIGSFSNGSVTVESASVEIPTKTSSWSVYDCSMNCINITVKEIDC